MPPADNARTRRATLRPLFRRLTLNLWLNFGQGRKGKRDVRVLTGGIITSGDAPLPRKPYGDDADDDGDRPSAGSAASGALPQVTDANDASPVGVDRAEDVSFSKVHRGDRIRTCGLLVPNQALYQAELRPAGCGRLLPTVGFIGAAGECQIEGPSPGHRRNRRRRI